MSRIIDTPAHYDIVKCSLGISVSNFRTGTARLTFDARSTHRHNSTMCYLLSIMTKGMKFPPWDPIPLLTIVTPATAELRIAVEGILQ